MSVRPGTRLDGRYRLADRLAYGGMGEVWRASDEVLSREVAVKILRPELAEDEAFVRRFRAEARTTSGLPHNGIAAVYDYGETRVGADGQSPASYNDPDADPVAYLVMELVPGEALSSMLSRDGALSAEKTLDLVAQAARALHAAHLRGVIHRDIKPANLMVTPDGRVKVTDFGIARPLDHEPLTATGQVMGTAHYLAPELAKGQDASPLSDVYALGVVAYECLAGHRPFEGDNQVAVALAHLNENPPPLPATVPPQVRAVVGAAMEKEPQRRMPSAEAFAAALDTLRYRQGTDEHLTPGTGIIPGTAAAAGLAAAGLFGAQEAHGWTPGGPGGRDGMVGTAPAPVPSVVPPPGTHLLGPAGDGPGRNGRPTSTVGLPGTSGGRYAAGMPAGGPPNQGGYGPFHTPTAPRGLPVSSGGLRERPRRSIGGPVLIAAGVATVLVIALLVAWINGGMGGSPASQDIPSSTPAAVSPPTQASSTAVSRSATATHTSHRASTTHPTTKSPSPSTTTPTTTAPTSTAPTTTPPTTSNPPTTSPPTTSNPPTTSPPTNTAGGTTPTGSPSKGAPGTGAGANLAGGAQ
jgi:eukaryotic-like serine/threonine-protein kinase